MSSFSEKAVDIFKKLRSKNITSPIKALEEISKEFNLEDEEKRKIITNTAKVSGFKKSSTSSAI